MRLKIAALIALLLAAPAHAQVEQDFALANKVFGQLSATAVTDGIDGEWLPLTVLANLRGGDPDPGLIDSLLERICGNDPIRGAVFTAIDDTSFEMLGANTRGEMRYRFDWIDGAEFYRSFDPAQLFSVLKFDAIEGESGVKMRADAMDAYSGTVHFYRVSPDVLTMVSKHGAEVYGRCPN
ncbi:hypothetical protein SAMN06295905_0560 [Devosia lucknowensis]|uniref:Uncharacterized protein n=1 Tax=Devosia lucknowensis TaxID=1096929 RepID=A0A1Y6EL83_9HYPH|nr:hypothetical protein [Devosia lucknowensis]SMQ61710.1 hypothetical protein SAMN06295905_0560 [Devosia lucknowensis]